MDLFICNMNTHSGLQYSAKLKSYIKIQTLIQGHDLTSTIPTLMVDLEGDECGTGFRDSDTIIQSTEELRLNWKFTLLCECSGVDQAEAWPETYMYLQKHGNICCLCPAWQSFRRAVTEKEVAPTKFRVNSLNTDVKVHWGFSFSRWLLAVLLKQWSLTGPQSVLHVPPQFLLITWHKAKDANETKSS